ncbi:MAG TPA: immunoglobulin domain-containing protein [Steroidobacteraceae bacterium]|nr:immunoglobulin domain-containing protein [Steroidobacteraceae bacterium]
MLRLLAGLTRKFFPTILAAALAACGQVDTTTNPGTDPSAVPPSITTQPTPQSVQEGEAATFAVEAAGSSPLTYQWQRDGAAIAGATGASLVVTPAVSDSGAMYSVIVSNSVGTVQSEAARLTVMPAAAAPTIVTQPANQTVTASQTASFTVTANGTAPLSYQWQKNGAPIAGATSATYTTPTTTTADNGALFAVVVQNAAGSVTSVNAVLTVNAANGGVSPTITVHPADKTVQAGQSASFTVTATGTQPLSYQWRKNGSVIPGAGAPSYTTPPATSADSGATFSAVVSNQVGQATSRAALLTVTIAPTAPSITTQPGDQRVASGQTATFTVVATGTAPLTYLWSRNGTPISGATAASYTTGTLTTADSGSTFSVVVSNSIGKATSRYAVLTVTGTSAQGTDIVTFKYNAARTGLNANETRLTTTNVNPNTFGLKHFLSTDGKVDGQPLYLSALNVGGATHNVVFATTENDSVYAFDADSGTQLWKASLVPSGETPSDTRSCDEVTPMIGITSTPVIDRSAGAHGAIYVIAMTVAGTTYHHRLHALDVTTGAEIGTPTDIKPTFNAASGQITFDPAQYTERSGLLLLNHTIYTAWTSHCDHQFYTGWIVAFSQSTLQQSAVLNVAPNSGGVGPAIWMSGGGLAADSSGYVYLITANGAFETTLDSNGFPNMQDYGNSFLKLSTAGGGLSVSDYFTLFNTADETSQDWDLGSGGIMLLPDLTDSGGTVRHLAVGAGKDGNLYVVNRDSMGRYNAASNNIWQQLTGALGNIGSSGNQGGIWGTPAYFNGHVYYGPRNDFLRSFTISSAKLSTPASSASTNGFLYPGTSPSVSANGTSQAIVWAHQNGSTATLHAYDANNLATELYSSATAPNGRDQYGAGNKFIVPVVADGHVFVGATNGVAVYGLLN